ncbi:MAG: glycosyl hydrolase [Planctomycetes bacterium RBG_13_63_9]|nr:MAG: glycosyl hydrolase [Planctomycetes bacterium RBG_13_63_9]
MRLLCLAAVVLSGANVFGAENAPSADLSPKEAKRGFVRLFDGKTLDGWQGSLKGYAVEDGVMICKPGGNLYTKKEYGDFVFRFEFKVPAGGNNGVGIRTPMNVNAAYHGMEIQILDDEAYKGQIQPYQAHGSIYGVVPAKPGHLKPAGEWNSEEIRCQGSHVKVTLNGTVIVDADLSTIDKTIDGQDHPGLHNPKGYIGFLGHGSPVEFRNIRIKELKAR